jgi:hypothetical protein
LRQSRSRRACQRFQRQTQFVAGDVDQLGDLR